MTVATSLIFDIRQIAGLATVEEGVEIKFEDGTLAFLDAAHPNFAVCRITAESHAGRARPVGLVLDAERRVIDLNAAHDTTVRFVREDTEDRNRLMVGFWGYSPICYLTRDHPEFERIHSQLAAAVDTDRRVWVANHSEMVVTEPQGDVEGETWWKILDVRPA
jgi:hypothetical protein